MQCDDKKHVLNLQKIKIRFWQNIISPHQVEVFKYLASKQGVEVSLVVQEELSSERLKMGWKVPVLSNVAVERGIDDEKTKQLLCKKQHVEIFTTPWGYPSLRQAFRQAVGLSDVKIALMSEPGDWRGPSGMLRTARGRLHSALYKNRLAFVLAIGGLAEQWFQKCHFPKEKVFPYAYTTSKGRFEAVRPDDDTAVHFIFIGQLIHRKGPELLLLALSSFKNLDWHLHVAGDGPTHSYLKILTRLSGIDRRVSFYGKMDNDDATELLTKSDVLILPSRWDGWGAVVNEALHRGVPVLCSDACGAKSLIRSGVNGAVFRRESVESIREKIGAVLSESSSFPRKSAKIREDARRFSGEEVGAYLLEVIKYKLGQRKDRPLAAWLPQS